MGWLDGTSTSFAGGAIYPGAPNTVEASDVDKNAAVKYFMTVVTFFTNTPSSSR